MRIQRLAIILIASPCALGWQSNSLLSRRRRVISVSVASRDVELKEEKVPYVIARGDGSTGGGGLPMPNAKDDNTLTRPKVGAAMPEG